MITGLIRAHADWRHYLLSRLAALPPTLASAPAGAQLLRDKYHD
ncbi:MAG: hypothetical protein ACLPV8_19650 [Steroidobacteraceae bacterium]